MSGLSGKKNWATFHVGESRNGLDDELKDEEKEEFAFLGWQLKVLVFLKINVMKCWETCLLVFLLKQR